MSYSEVERHPSVASNLERTDILGDAATPEANVGSVACDGTNWQLRPEKLRHGSRSGKAVRPHILTLSAPDPVSLKALARSYAEWLAQTNAPALGDICYSAGVRSAHDDHRLASVATTAEVMAHSLRTFAERGRCERICHGIAPAQPKDRPVFVFTGMGPQWWAMGRELIDGEPVFRQAAEEVDEAFRALTGWSILAEMLCAKERSRIGETQVAQPANFLLQVALSELLRSWGVLPAAVVGHSVGEVSAAYVSGVLDLRDAVRVSYHRSRLQQQAMGKGRMLATALPLQDARTLIADYQQRVSIAAVNSAGATTLSGDPDALAAISAKLERKDIFSHFLQVEVAYHSPHMEPLKPEMRHVLRDLQPCSPVVPIYSTVTGSQVDKVAYDAEYWCNNIREPVLFAEAIANILAQGHSGFLELGPHPILATYIKEMLKRYDAQGHVFTCLRREEPEQLTILMGLARLYVSGYTVNWQALSGAGSRFVTLLPKVVPAGQLSSLDDWSR